MSKTMTRDAIEHDQRATGRTSMAPEAKPDTATILPFPTAPEFADAMEEQVIFANGRPIL